MPPNIWPRPSVRRPCGANPVKSPALSIRPATARSAGGALGGIAAVDGEDVAAAVLEPAVLAVVLVEEVLTQRNYDGASRSHVIATNVFERAGGEWLMILHHGSPILAPPDDEPPLQ